MHILHSKINSLLPKIDEIRFIAKQSNASMIEISESKLDSSILNSELDTDDYDLIRLNRSKGGDGVDVILESPYLMTIRQDFFGALKAFL